MADVREVLRNILAAYDDSTGALLVKLGAGVDIGDVNLLNIAGSTIDPATEGKQDTGNTSLAAILAKIIAAPATEAKQVHYSRIKGAAQTLIDDVKLDDNPTSYTSSSIDVEDYDAALFFIRLDATLTPTDIVFEVQFSHDDTNFYKYMEGAWADFRYEDTVPAAAQVNESFPVPMLARYMRVKATATGTDATNYFETTVAIQPIG